MATNCKCQKDYAVRGFLNTEEGKRTQADPRQNNFILCPSCKPSVYYSGYRSDYWNIHGQTFELWNTLNSGDLEEFTFLMESCKFLGIPKYASLFLAAFYFYQNQVPMKCPKTGRVI